LTLSNNSKREKTDLIRKTIGKKSKHSKTKNRRIMEQETNKPDLFSLLAQWASHLPKEGVVNSAHLTNLTKVGQDIQQLCSQIEQQNMTSPTAQQQKQSEPSKDLKPSFIFQLTCDQTVNKDLTQFECVHDFCQKLQDYCEQNASHLNIEHDWLKLLLACSPHNYERFMWIHFTFQRTSGCSSTTSQLKWPQVKRRLMSKFDHPKRRIQIQSQIANFKYIPEIEPITVANKKFKRLADEIQINVNDQYIRGLPIGIQDVLLSTIAFDESKSFYIALDDIQQRATVFINAKEGDFCFYSKSAHIALSLEHEKVNKKDCEFHMLADHSTSSCPDYVIVKYPYMAFTTLPGVKYTKLSVSPTPPPSSQLAIEQHGGLITVQSSTSPGAVVVNNNNHTQQQQMPKDTSSSSIVSPQVNHMIMQSKADPDLLINDIPPVQSVSLLPAAQPNDNVSSLSRTNGSLQSPQQPVDEYANIGVLQIVEHAKKIAALGQPLPESLRLRVQEINSQMMLPKPLPTTIVAVNEISRYRSPSPIGSRYLSHDRSLSPKRRYGDDHNSRSDDEEDEVRGCIIHGQNSKHTTKQCRKGQMIITTSRCDQSVSPPPQKSKENICIFCGLLFKPGHLGYCKKIRNKRH
jgi:hypothetical protein